MRRKRKTRVRFIPFMRWMLQWYILSFGLIIAMMSIVLLVGKAVENHQTKVDLIRSGQYVEPDFQDTWKTKKASAATLTKYKYPKEIITHEQ